MKKVMDLFPGLKDLGIDGDAAVKTVNDFEALEVVRKLCTFEFGGPPTIKASLSFWYLPAGVKGWPLVGEFSFDYDAPDDGANGEALESYPSEVARKAGRFFKALQSQEGWFDLDGTTKTAFVFEVL